MNFYVVDLNYFREFWGGFFTFICYKKLMNEVTSIIYQQLFDLQLN